jgi:predicted ATPase
MAAFAAAAAAPVGRPQRAGDRDGAAVGPDGAIGDAATPAARRLPRPPSSFVGRESELRDLAERIAAGRLITLTGPGGTGKTRLAIRAATDIAARFADGAIFADLSATTDPDGALAEIATSIGADARAGSTEDALRAALADLDLLLVLDNLENVVAIGPAIGRLLDAAPTVAILATSRVPLHLQAEIEVAVRPLDLPSPTAATTATRAAESPAVRLFAVRAASARPDFSLTDSNAADVAAICRRLDGLPLAIELAAARVRVLSTSQILDRLGDRLAILTGGPVDLPERQRTLRSTIAWSHDLLDAPARVLFRRLAVFDGGLTFEGAESVCPDLAPEVLLDAMTALVDGNLLSRVPGDDGEPRFTMLETIREFAQEQLELAAERPQAERRHLERFAALASRFAAEQTPATLDGWLDRLDRDRANLAAALARGPGLDAAGTGAMVSSLIDYLRARWHSGTVRALLGTLVAEGVLDDARRGPLLHEAAYHAVRQGDFEAAARSAAESLAIARRRGDHHGAVGAGHILSIAAAERGDFDAEGRYLAATIEDADRSGEPRMQIIARSHEALRALRTGDFAEAARRYDEVLATMRTVDVMQESLGSAVFNRGLAELHGGRLGAAAASLAESARIARSMDDRDLLGYILEGYAALAIAGDRPADAARFQGAASVALAHAGSELEGFEAAMRERSAAAARVALGDDGYALERGAGAATAMADILDGALELGRTFVSD